MIKVFQSYIPAWMNNAIVRNPKGIFILSAQADLSLLASKNVGGQNSFHMKMIRIGIQETDSSIVWTWGANSYGQLGDNTVTLKSSPVSVIGVNSFKQITSSVNGTLGLKSDGSAWTWGYNTLGELGINTNSHQSSPVSVVGGHSFIAIYGGGSTNVCLKSDGSVWGWGVNNSGQLGDNTTINKSSPVSVVGGHSFIKISGGRMGSYGLKADGSMWTWGGNSSGSLGDNTTVAKSSPISVVGGHVFTDMSCGTVDDGNCYAIKSDGSIWAWGANVNMELSTITTTGPRSSPVAILDFVNANFKNISLV